jgi:uncharacterized protein
MPLSESQRRLALAATYTYPGVYVEELNSPVHTLTGVATSIAAFVGYTAAGIDNRAQEIYSFSDFQRLYGGLASDSELSYAVQHFFLNGGSQAIVVRVPRTGSSAAKVVFGGLTFSSLSSGGGAANGDLVIDIDTIGLNLTTDPLGFNLTVTRLSDGAAESFPGLTLNSAKKNFLSSVLNDADNGSQLVKVTVPSPVPSTALISTGVAGTALTTAGLNTAVGGAATTTTATQDFSLVLNLPTSPATIVPVKVFRSGGPIPQTLAGVASQVQQAINMALAIKLPGASVLCSVVPSGAGSGLRVNANAPKLPATLITFTSPASGGDAATALGLKAPAVANVAHYALGSGGTSGSQTSSTVGSEGTGLPTTTDLIGDQSAFSGLYALLKTDIFNLLCIPDATRALASDPGTLDSTVDPATIYTAAISLCKDRRAMVLIDAPPNVRTVAAAVDWKSSTLGVVDPNGAAFFPRLRLADPLNGSQLRTFAPSGVVAGVYASTDASRGVWKAPAGVDAVLRGVQSMTYALSDLENGSLNPLGVNCFRTFPLYGPVLWGSRTLVGADAMASQWKYVPVRRMALFLEESLYRGMKWAVFEPNDEPLWASIRLNAEAFMHQLFRKGAFQGATPAEAYFVKCDSETTTQADIDQGIVNILIGFAPLKPAEFVVIQIEQLTGQAES